MICLWKLVKPSSKRNNQPLLVPSSFLSSLPLLTTTIHWLMKINIAISARISTTLSITFAWWAHTRISVTISLTSEFLKLTISFISCIHDLSIFVLACILLFLNPVAYSLDCTLKSCFCHWSNTNLNLQSTFTHLFLPPSHPPPSLFLTSNFHTCHCPFDVQKNIV